MDTHLHNCAKLCKQLHYTARSAQRDPPGLVLEAGGDFNLAGSYACKVEVPPTSRFQVGGTSALQAWLPAKLKSPPLQAQVRGGSRWADLAVWKTIDVCDG